MPPLCQRANNNSFVCGYLGLQHSEAEASAAPPPRHHSPIQPPKQYCFNATLRTHPSVFITDWMLAENSGNVLPFSKSEHFHCNSLILKLCSTLYLENLTETLRYLLGGLRSPDTELSHRRIIFSKTTALVCHRKRVISNDLKHLEFSSFCFKQLHTTVYESVTCIHSI